MCRCWRSDLWLLATESPLACDLRSHDSESFHSTRLFGLSPRDLRHPLLPAKQDRSSSLICRDALNPELRLAGVAWSGPSPGDGGSSPTVAPRRWGSTPIRQTCDPRWALYQKRHPCELGLNESQSKFIDRTWPISKNGADVSLF
jgi:hypothetical protein